MVRLEEIRFGGERRGVEKSVREPHGGKVEVVAQSFE